LRFLLRPTPLERGRLVTFAALVALVTPACAPCRGAEAGSATHTARATPTSPEALRLEAIAGRLHVLSDEFSAFWKTHGPDRVHGAFHGTLDRQGRPTAPTDKGLIQEARHLWSMSLWYQRREPTPEVKALADGLYTFLVRNFRDADAEFFFSVSQEGTPVDRSKVLYAQAFAIYALTAYGRAFHVPDATAQALACFRSFDARAHDAEHGGYRVPGDPPWLTPGAAKETNTHLHLLESLSSLFEATHDRLLQDRVEELIDLFLGRIVQPDGHAAKDFSNDWQPFGPAAVSYGHDLETSWLLLEAVRALGPGDARQRERTTRAERAARRLAENSVALGFDPDQGGFFEEGPPGGPPSKLEKVWWVQAEALPALEGLHRLTNDASHLGRLERTLDFIEQKQRDREYGGWYWGILPDGSLGPHGSNKGSAWKASYHELRALVFTEDRLRAFDLGS
jgi:mannobiose 2-epimerase